MIRKGQLGAIKEQALSVANQFYSLAFRSPSASRSGLASLRYCDTTKVSALPLRVTFQSTVDTRGRPGQRLPTLFPPLCIP